MEDSMYWKSQNFQILKESRFCQEHSELYLLSVWNIDDGKKKIIELSAWNDYANEMKLTTVLSSCI